MLLGTIVLLLIARTTPASFWYGLPLVVMGELVRVWSAGSLKKMDQLTVNGPFALCRNPLYMGSFLMTAGYLVMCYRIDVAVIGFVLYWVFHGGAIVYEEGMLRERYGQVFDNYCKAAPRLVPCLNLNGARGGFSWDLLSENLEYRTAISSLVVVILFGLIAYDVLGLGLLGWR
jgi:protein-S-isoprenylcysteine O-methyltransferase Ste14